MSKPVLPRLTVIYNAVFAQSNLPLVLNEDLMLEALLKIYADRDECILHLSLIRRLFNDEKVVLTSHSKAVSSSMEDNSVEGVHVVEGDSEDGVCETRPLLCRKLLDSDLFIPTILHYLSSGEQVTSFTASKALTAVLGSKQCVVQDKSKLENVLNAVFATVNLTSLTDHKSTYCLQLLTDLLKYLRKHTIPKEPPTVLLASLTVLRTHWPRILQVYNTACLSPSSHTATASIPNPVTQTASVLSVSNEVGTFPIGQDCGLSLGEFISLTVEVLRHVECRLHPDTTTSSSPSEVSLGTMAASVTSLLQELQVMIIRSLCTLTSVVNHCRSNSLYLLKRLLDVCLKCNSFHANSVSCSSQYPSQIIANSPATQPHNSTGSPAAHPHNSTGSPSPHPHNSAVSPAPQPQNSTVSPAAHPHNKSESPAPQSHNTTVSPAPHPHYSTVSPAPHITPPHTCTSLHTNTQANTSSTTPIYPSQESPLTHTLQATSQPSLDSPPTLASELTTNPGQVLRYSLMNLLQNPSLSISFQFWLKKFMRIAGLMQEAPVETKDSDEAVLSVEDELKSTILRNACLLMLEYIAAIVMNCQSHLTDQVFLDLESLLQTILMWAKIHIPPSLTDTMGGLLHDDIDSPSVDFLRLLFYSILTEQDDCLVRALISCMDIHNALYRECDDLSLDIPILNLCLGIFNVHAFFVKFLSSAGYDTTMLLDFVMSPETKFSQFLTTYLEIVCREKKTASAFNYDLPSACAELDIVDEYMTMGLAESGSEDGDSGEMTQYSAAVPSDPGLVDSFESRVTEQHSEYNREQFEKSVPCDSAVRDIASSLGKRELSSQISEPQGPVLKKIKLHPASESAVMEAELLSISEENTHIAPLTLNQAEASVQGKMAHCTPDTLSPLKDVDSSVSALAFNQLQEDAHPPLHDQPEGPPPIQTLRKVLGCLIELGKTLGRLCSRELLSLRVNNVGYIVRLTEELQELYADIDLEM